MGLPGRKRSLPPVGTSLRRMKRRVVVWGMQGHHCRRREFFHDQAVQFDDIEGRDHAAHAAAAGLSGFRPFSILPFIAFGTPSVRIAFPPLVPDAMLEIEKGCVPRGDKCCNKIGWRARARVGVVSGRK